MSSLCLSVPVLAVLTCAAAGPAAAHEFWIEPLDYRVPEDGTLAARLVNGSEFDGVNIAYFPNRIVDFSIHYSGMSAPVLARIGDQPALQLGPPLPDAGLFVIAYQSTPSELTYADYATFERFAYHKDLEALAFTHEARGLSRDHVTERYTRFSKALVAVGDGEGRDMRVGYEVEFVLDANPYTSDVREGLPVQLFYGDAPLPDHQVEMFARLPGDGAVSITYHRTDATGMVRLPVQSGMEYMIDAVLLRVPTEEIIAETGMQWETLWANMTFMVP